MNSAFKRKGCGPQALGSAVKLAPILGMIAKKVIVDKVAKKVSSATPLKFEGANSGNSSCWKGYKKVGTKKSPTNPGVTVNDCKKI
jgi:hypothetical protein